MRRVTSRAYRIPTDAPESDGTLEWDSTTLVTVHIDAGGEVGFGYTYSHEAAALLINSVIGPAIEGLGAMDIPAAHARMTERVRNLGGSGLTATAISAVDVALWDLKARLLGLPLSALIGSVRDKVAVYGSGGFTSYDDPTLARQLGGWAEEGLRMVKMKVGRAPENDMHRVSVARSAVGGEVQLFVDANGAYRPKEALSHAAAFAAADAAWFEEPTASDDLEGLRLVRECGPAGMAIAAGEYGYTPEDFRDLLHGGCVDVLQADASRCRGISGFLEAAALCRAYDRPLSAHTAPSLHIAACCAAPAVVHLEWFHDHVRIEEMLFEGAARPKDGFVSPPPGPGLGIEFRAGDAAQYAVWNGE